MKQCKRCGVEKPLTEFYRQSRRRNDGRKIDGSRGGQGVLALCKPCWREYTYEGNIRRRYGLTVQAYMQMKADGCRLCGAHERLVLDHDHSNGRLRAMLCSNCNSGLGMFQDDPSRMRAAAEYIEEWRREHA